MEIHKDIIALGVALGVLYIGGVASTPSDPQKRLDQAKQAGATTPNTLVITQFDTRIHLTPIRAYLPTPGCVIPTDALSPNTVLTPSVVTSFNQAFNPLPGMTVNEMLVGIGQGDTIWAYSSKKTDDTVTAVIPETGRVEFVAQMRCNKNGRLEATHNKNFPGAIIQNRGSR